VNLDEIEYLYPQFLPVLMPLVRSGGYRGGVPSDLLDFVEEQTPWRTFGGQQAGAWGTGPSSVHAYIANSVDPYRKNIRLIECQHKIRVMQRNIVDLETGDREPIPTHFTPEQIQKLIQWCAEQYAMRGQPCPLRVEWRPTKRVRWTTMIGDIIVYDDWSPYESYTLVPYFPYFRRGKTRGMVDDLVDPQREINKRRSSQIDTVTRVAHSGWMWHKDSLRRGREGEDRVARRRARHQHRVEGRPDNMKPSRIEPGTLPTAIKEPRAKSHARPEGDRRHQRFGARATRPRAVGPRHRSPHQAIGARHRDVHGQQEAHEEAHRPQEARTAAEPLHRAAPVQVPGAKRHVGKHRHQPAQATGEILNDVTIGRYGLAVDETPLSASFLSAQFEELMALVEKGILPIPMVQDIAVDLSTAPQKELLKARLQAYLKAQGFITPDEMVMMQAQGMAVPPGMLPPDPTQAQAGKQGGPAGNKNGEGGQVGPTGASPSGAPALPAPAAGAGAAPGGV
jgi:hypothetical protein